MAWIKCSEQMPPDDNNQIIVKYAYRDNFICLRGFRVYSQAEWRLELDDKWTPYTSELWKELNR